MNGQDLCRTRRAEAVKVQIGHGVDARSIGAFSHSPTPN
jgi:hypothetical protein